MYLPRGTWQSTERTCFWKGVLDERAIFLRVGVRSGCAVLDFLEEGDVVVVGKNDDVVSASHAGGDRSFFAFLSACTASFRSSSSSSSTLLFPTAISVLFSFPLALPLIPFPLPRNSKLLLSSSTRSTSPSSILCPKSMLSWSCCADMFLYAGDLILEVQGVSIPTIESKIMRAKQWSTWTGHLGWGGYQLSFILENNNTGRCAVRER